MLLTACFLTFSAAATSSLAPKISHATVLLPQDPNAVFTLSAMNGCFRFSTDRPDIIRLSSLSKQSETCTRQIQVSVNPDYSGSGKAVVFASETSSPNLEIRSEIIVSSIARLEVVTRIRRLSVNEQEAMQVQAYDRFGNLFSSLEGLEFRWSISDDSVLGVLPLTTAGYALSSPRLELELSGRQSDMLLVSGKAAGKTTLSVTHNSISSQSVMMSIVEPFSISPSILNIPVCGSGGLSILPISLPSKAFSFAVPLAVRQQLIVDSTGIVRSLSDRGVQTLVTVTDTRTDDNEETSRVCVAEISGITFLMKTKFPIAGEEISVQVVGESKECGDTVFLGGEEVDLVTGVTPGIASSQSTKSILTIRVPKIVGTKFTVRGELLSVLRDRTCVYNSTAVGAVEITAVSPLRVTVESPIVIPATQRIISVAIAGGSGEYTVIARPDDCEITVSDHMVRLNKCVGSIVVGDKHNANNRVSFRTELGEGEIGLKRESVETFIGSTEFFTEFIVAETNLGEYLYNCSSLVEKVYVSNTSVVAVNFLPSALPFVCGQIAIEPLVVGKTELVITPSNSSSSLRVPLTVHSSFAIESNSVDLPVIGINSSWEFTVTGGSLSHLRLKPNETLIEISKPWIADVVSNIAINRFRIVCRTAGIARAMVAHTVAGGIDFECVDVESVGVTSDPIGGVSENVFVTCGHGESHVLRVVGIDNSHRRILNITSAHTVMESSVGRIDGGGILTVPSMECGSNADVEVKVSLTSDRASLVGKAIVKARDTVRATMGPTLANSVLALPCEFTEIGDIASYAVQLVGGSGSYRLVTGNDSIVGKYTDGKSVPSVKELVLGEEGLYAVVIPATSCNQTSEFRVIDEAMPEPLTGQEMRIRTLPVERVKVRVNNIEKKKEAVPVVVAGEWFDLTLGVEYPFGQSYDSVSSLKYFALTEGVFGWSIIGSDVVVDLRSSGGRLMARIPDPTDKAVLTVSSRIAKVPSTIITVAVVKRAHLLPGLPPSVQSWIVKPHAPVQHILASGLDVDHLSSLGLTFEFLSSDESFSLKTRTANSVSVHVGNGSADITAFVKTAASNRSVYNVSQSIQVRSPAGLRINFGSPITVTINTVVSLLVNYVDEDHRPFFPPNQLADCDVKWSLYGSLPGQAIEYRFTQLGSIPVQVKAFCPNMGVMESSLTVHVVEDLRIQPVANLVTGSLYAGLSWPRRKSLETPGEVGSEFIELSDVEKGVVTYNTIASAVLESQEMGRALFVTEQAVVGHVNLRDSNGQLLVFPDNLSLSVGADNPEIVILRSERDSVIATGLKQGCARVFVYLRTDLVGLNTVCVKFPILPTVGDGIVLSGSTGALVRFLAGEDVGLFKIPRTGFEDSLDIKTVESFEVKGRFVEVRSETVPAVMGGDVRMARPLAGEFEVAPESLGTVRTRDQGLAVIEFGPSKNERHGNVMFNGIRIPVTISPVGRLEFESPKLLVHKQGYLQVIKLRPVSVSGAEYTESPLIDQRFKPVCEIDRNDIFLVRAVADGCEFVPEVVGANRAPPEIRLTVTIGSFAQTIPISVENHFHVVHGPYMTAVSVPRLETAEESVSLLLTNPTDDLELCEAWILGTSSHAFVSVINETGQFQVKRTSPRGSPDVSVRVLCGSQSLDFVVGFVETSKVVQETYVSEVARKRGKDSYTLTVLAWIAKMVGSIGVVVAVARLFKQRPEKVKLVKNEFRQSAPPQFAPSPHPDRDVFISH